MRDAVGITVARRPGAAGAVRWRLTAGNHRGLGLSARCFETETESEARAHARDVGRAARSLTPQIAHPRSSVDWKWTALDGAGNAVAASERTYGRYGTCVSAYRRFVLAITAATDASVVAEPGDGADPAAALGPFAPHS